MTHLKNIGKVQEIMAAFAAQTGLASPDMASRRYLWTDAFAVCNWFSLYRRTGDAGHKQRALDLIDQVHFTLCRHRPDDPRQGWISGLSEEEGKAHPTQGGLRIGKKMNERPESAPPDESLEWEQDGQYFHYLTKWMHALERAAIFTGEAKYCRWALELAKTAHAAFTYSVAPAAPKRMYWKMSIDLSRPLVTSMGHHDPLDALLTYNELQMCRMRYFAGEDLPDLRAEIAGAAEMCAGRNWATSDPLGLGGLMCDACRLLQMLPEGGAFIPLTPQRLLNEARAGLGAYLRQNQLTMPAEYRLAFRELGLSLGLRAVAWMDQLTGQDKGQAGAPLSQEIKPLLKVVALADEIEGFWLSPVNQDNPAWQGHCDINMVMLATSLLPYDFLSILDDRNRSP